MLSQAKVAWSRISFDERHQTKVHIAEIVLIVVAIGLCIGRLQIMDPPPTRSNILAMTMVRRNGFLLTARVLTKCRASSRWSSSHTSF